MSTSSQRSKVRTGSTLEEKQPPETSAPPPHTILRELPQSRKRICPCLSSLLHSRASSALITQGILRHRARLISWGVTGKEDSVKSQPRPLQYGKLVKSLRSGRWPFASQV